ncbi:hypothetical protein GQ43DRAFT_270601 [Delitschia confertaspora ATCC 74209]|uniref:Uncharacterized protein n=1 Tax=Delitschia confertaspora ATCC 74209 TaxID=1513339 RepID=A0A9P4MTU3_9PLEO|nr:hypothetical protein GQ43DRAFT_270601 [Delitschia confertaspora ATCC 74209]
MDTALVSSVGVRGARIHFPNFSSSTIPHFVLPWKLFTFHFVSLGWLFCVQINSLYHTMYLFPSTTTMVSKALISPPRWTPPKCMLFCCSRDFGVRDELEKGVRRCCMHSTCGFTFSLFPNTFLLPLASPRPYLSSGTSVVV